MPHRDVGAGSGEDGPGAQAVHVRGFEVTGSVELFSAPRLSSGVLANEMHAYIGSWIRDSALGVLDHRVANGLVGS